MLIEPCESLSGPLTEASGILFCRTVEYALRAVAYLAVHDAGTGTIQEISEGTKIPAPYLRKVLAKLRAKGLIHSQRGTGGGITLVADPQTTTILEVVDAVDPIVRIEQCPLGLPDHVNLCPLHHELDQAILSIQQALGSKTIAELLPELSDPNFTCRFPVKRSEP